jgi:outer membrane biosynthesis protein TonB
MRSGFSLLRIGCALALVAVLAGCTKGGQFDPTEIFNSETFDTKKKLKGDREPVFPGGVPGATTGVPPDLVKGYQPPPDQPEDAGLPAAPPEAATKMVAAKPKPKLKPKVAVGPTQQQPQQPQQQQKQDPIWSQAPAPSKSAPISVSGSSPAAAQGQGAASPWPASQPAQSNQTAWPSPPPTTTR